MRSAVTISLVPQARGGPFIFWDDLERSIAQAAKLGYDAVEIFAPSASGLDVGALSRLLPDHHLKLAAVGTGAGWVVHKLRLTDPDPAIRAKAKDFVRAMIEAAAPFGAPTIVGSMQGRWEGEVSKDQALALLADALQELGSFAERLGVPLIYEPLNRYETNLCTTIGEGAALLQRLSTRNVKLLADLFHMNIEEADVPMALVAGQQWIGHVHLADSNRRPAGLGHTDFDLIAAALRQMNYQGYLSAEALPYPDPDAAAEQTMRAYRQFFL